jgi:hypothetical protein
MTAFRNRSGKAGCSRFRIFSHAAGVDEAEESDVRGIILKVDLESMEYHTIRGVLFETIDAKVGRREWSRSQFRNYGDNLVDADSFESSSGSDVP